MKTKMMILFLVTLVMGSVALAGNNPPFTPLPPPWFTLYWQCDPANCQSNGGPWYSGAVSTTAAAGCADGLYIQVSARSWVSDCTSAYYLTSSASHLQTTRWYKWPSGKTDLEDLEGLSAITQRYYSNMQPVAQPYYETWMCDNEHRTGVPQVGPC